MRVLFICPNWAGLADPIVKEMRKQGHDVVHLDSADFSNFQYFDHSHRVLAKLYQLLTKNSYKHRVTNHEITRTIQSFFISRTMFDVIVMTEPSLFQREHIELFKFHTKKIYATLWDSLTKAPDNQCNLDLFDSVFSYDCEDCEKFKFNKISNYLDPSWQTNVSIEKAEYDVFSIMSFTRERYKKVIDFLDSNPNINPKIYFYVDHPRKHKLVNDTRIRVTDKLILGNELKSHIEQSKAILDLLQGHQAGLSFRVYESLGYKRKLITTNSNLKYYDIYTPDNMHVLSSSYKVPEVFFQTPYQVLAPQVTEKYLLSSWVGSVLDETKA